MHACDDINLKFPTKFPHCPIDAIPQSMPPSFNDGYLEVVGVNGVMHLSQISAHLRSGKRLGQYKTIEFKVSADMPVQVSEKCDKSFHCRSQIFI